MVDAVLGAKLREHFFEVLSLDVELQLGGHTCE